jgi:hypothetical protein
MSAVVVVLIGICWRQASNSYKEKKDYEAIIAALEPETKRLKQKIEQLEQNNAQLVQAKRDLSSQHDQDEIQIRFLQQELAKCTDDPKLKEAKLWWGDHVKEPLDSLPGLMAEVEDQRVRDYLNDWCKGLANLDTEWCRADSELRGQFNGARTVPWSDIVNDAKGRQKVLDTARGAWEKWANTPVDNIEALRGRLPQFSGPQQDILRGWLDNTENGGNFRLSLIKGSTPEDSDESRLFTLSVDGTRIGESWDHAWPGGKTYDYEKSAKDADRQRTFTWKGGQSIEILLEASRAWYAGAHRNLIKNVDTHPLALWKLARDRKLSDGKNTVTFKIEPTSGRIPGPPPRKHIDANHPPILGNTQ